MVRKKLESNCLSAAVLNPASRSATMRACFRHGLTPDSHSRPDCENVFLQNRCNFLHAIEGWASSYPDSPSHCVYSSPTPRTGRCWFSTPEFPATGCASCQASAGRLRIARIRSKATALAGSAHRRFHPNPFIPINA
jgi:hypothetical protein